MRQKRFEIRISIRNTNLFCEKEGVGFWEISQALRPKVQTCVLPQRGLDGYNVTIEELSRVEIPPRGAGKKAYPGA